MVLSRFDTARQHQIPLSPRALRMPVVWIGFVIACLLGCGGRPADPGGSFASTDSVSRKGGKMVLDRLENAQRYESLHPNFRAAFDFLRRSDLATLSLGRHEIDGDRVYAVVSRGTGTGRQAAKLEFHRRYIDIQFIIEGAEEAGWKPISQCGRLLEAYEEQRDAGFYGDPPDAWLTLEPGTFVIYFPEDGHAPMAGGDNVHKVVVKVAY